MELLIGILLAFMVFRYVSSKTDIIAKLPCNERRQPHKWEWVAEGLNDRLKCKECGYTFGEE